MKESIRRFSPEAEFATPEGCFIIELSNTPDDLDVSIARVRVAPGMVTRWHRLEGTAERYIILSGKGRVEIGDLRPQEVSAGDVVLIPPSSRQRIANPGPAELIFLAVCTPRFRPEAYEDIDSHPGRGRGIATGGIHGLNRRKWDEQRRESIERPTGLLARS